MDTAAPGQNTLQTTLDRRIQTLAETALRENVDALRPLGVTNGAVVVIENGTAAVRAMVGSCDFSSVEDSGQINGARALRSPGSALKPFIYALALEQGVITPESILADVPASYVGYDPENYDRQFRGPITAREALWASRNVPAVGLAERVGQRRLYGFLKEAGLTSLTRAPEHYGLSIALGSTEVSLLELTNAYAALARLGEYRPYRTLEAQPVTQGTRILSEAAAWLVADMLADTSRLGGKPLWKSERSQIRMAWKTGTSNGHRDAWTVAYTPEYTVGVWLGNFSGKPSRALVGIEAAAPIVARIMDRVYAEKSPTWFAMPASVGARTLCALSGMPFGEHCPCSVSGCYISGVSSDRVCSVHVLGPPRSEAQAHTAGPLMGGGTFETLMIPPPPAVTAHDGTAARVIEVWPDDVAGWLRQHGRLAPAALRLALRFGAGDDGRSKPRISSPMPRQTYVLEAGVGDRQKLLLQAASAGNRIYWFVDGALYRDCPPDEQTFWTLRRGEHKVTCSDDSGHSASVEISVR